jgi:hypothetical protein
MMQSNEKGERLNRAFSASVFGERRILGRYPRLEANAAPLALNTQVKIWPHAFIPTRCRSSLAEGKKARRRPQLLRKIEAFPIEESVHACAA